MLVQFLVLAPISVFAGIVYLFQHVWSWGWVFLQLLHFAVQVSQANRNKSCRTAGSPSELET